jgi:hypothetical protein
VAAEGLGVRWRNPMETPLFGNQKTRPFSDKAALSRTHSMAPPRARPADYDTNPEKSTQGTGGLTKNRPSPALRCEAMDGETERVCRSGRAADHVHRDRIT